MRIDFYQLARELAYLNSGYSGQTVYMMLTEQLKGVSESLPVLEQFLEILDKAETTQAYSWAFDEIIEAEGLN